MRASTRHDPPERTQLNVFVLLILAALLATPCAFSGQDASGNGSGQLPRKDKTGAFRPDEVVVKISKHRIDAKESLKHVGLAIASSNATGYCLGQGKCDLILTNYHVAERAGSPLEVSGIKVLQTYEATSSQDKDAVWEQSPLGFSVKLAPVRDIAIFRMERPLKGMHGIPISTQELNDGEDVRVFGFPGGKKLTTILAAYYGQTKDGILIFKAKPGYEKALIPGLSGSLVVNEKNQAVGLVNSAGNTIIGAVPAWSISNFIKAVQSTRYPEIFPFSDGGEILRPNSSGLMPVNLVAETGGLVKDVDHEVGMSPPPALPEEYLSYNLDQPTPPLAAGIVSNENGHMRAVEPHNVQVLRMNAEDMVKSINDFIAVGTERSFGGKTPETRAQYQLRMVAGSQTFTMDGQELHELPCPKENGFGVGSAWSKLPTMVGDDLKLSIQQVDDLSLQGWGNVKVFRYEGAAEDKVAQIKYCTDYGLGLHTEKIISMSVRGEVWTDSALNILRITQELQAPPSMGWLNTRAAVLYGWLESPDGERKLVPTNIVSRAELTDDNQIYSTICRITDYHRFTVSVVVGGQILGPIY